MLGIDQNLDAIAELLADPDHGVAELTEDNLTVWHHGETDPDEDITNGINKCRGVSALIYDLGGDTDPAEASNPVIYCTTAIELYVDTTKRNRRKTPELRLAGEIRDNIMRVLHLSPFLMDGAHCHMEPRISGYKPIADPAYVVFRILLRRSIILI